VSGLSNVLERALFARISGPVSEEIKQRAQRIAAVLLHHVAAHVPVAPAAG
jgi:hypothetical protein